MEYFFILCLLSFYSCVKAEKQCATVKGQLECLSDPSKHVNVKVQIYDRDKITSDDLMGETFTDSYGRFVLRACGEDWGFGFGNKPDPYIYVTHSCNSIFEHGYEMDEIDIMDPLICWFRTHILDGGKPEEKGLVLSLTKEFVGDDISKFPI